MLVRARRHLAPTEPHRQVRLYFSSFGFEQGADFVNVYDGPTTSHPLLARLTGSSLPHPVRSTSGSLLVVMQTDASNNDSAPRHATPHATPRHATPRLATPRLAGSATNTCRAAAPRTALTAPMVSRRARATDRATRMQA
jgi:hypothetical protein